MSASKERRIECSSPDEGLSLKLPCAIVFTVAFLASLNTIFNGFIYDDTEYFLNNPFYTDYRNILTILASSDYAFDKLTDVSNYYRPLPSLYYVAMHYTLGLSPPAMHLINVIVHSLCSIAVLLVANELFKQTDLKNTDNFRGIYALLAALLFATHPIHVEAVAWVSAISELMLALFFLLSFLLYLRGRYAWGALLYFLSLLCKEPAVTLLILLVAYDATSGRRLGLKHALSRYAPFAVASVAYLALRLNALNGAVRELDKELGLFDTIPSILPLFGLYMKKLAFPVRLSPYTHFDPYCTFGDLSFIFTLIAIIASAVVLYALYRKERSLPALLSSAIVIPLLPALYLPGLVLNMNVYADRYLYLPSAAFAMLFVYIVCEIARMKKASDASWRLITAFFLVITALYSFQTMRTNATWKNEETLIRSAYEKAPDDYQVVYTLSSRAHMEGRLDDATGLLKRAIALNESSARPNPKFKKISHTALAELYRKTGNLKAAHDETDAVLKIDPGYADAHYNMAVIYVDSGAYGLAIESYKLALKYSTLPLDKKNILNNLGNAYTYTGRYDEAIESYKGALALQPDDRMTLSNMAVAINRKQLTVTP